MGGGELAKVFNVEFGLEGNKSGNGLHTSPSHEEEEGHRVEQVAHAERLYARSCLYMFNRRHNSS